MTLIVIFARPALEKVQNNICNPCQKRKQAPGLGLHQIICVCECVSICFKFWTSDHFSHNFVRILQAIPTEYISKTYLLINLSAPDFLFILAHPVYKMRIIQGPNTLELWNKLHFEEKETESIYHV